jgi:hypothetical protein
MDFVVTEVRIRHQRLGDPVIVDKAFATEVQTT